MEASKLSGLIERSGLLRQPASHLVILKALNASQLQKMESSDGLSLLSKPPLEELG